MLALALARPSAGARELEAKYPTAALAALAFPGASWNALEPGTADFLSASSGRAISQPIAVSPEQVVRSAAAVRGARATSTAALSGRIRPGRRDAGGARQRRSGRAPGGWTDVDRA